MFVLYIKVGEFAINSQNSSKQKQLFEEKSIPSAVMSLALPTILSQIVIIVYNFADTWFAGRTGNPDDVAALTVCMPLYVIMNGISNLFGVGGASVIARNLGKNNPDGAKNAFKLSVMGTFILSVIYSIVMFFASDGILPLVGAKPSNLDKAGVYMFWTVVLGCIPTVLSNMFGHLIRSIGSSKPAAFGMALGAVMNIALDPLFMFVLLPKGNEVMGAAIATLISNICSCLFFIIYILVKKDDILRFDFKKFKPDLKILADVTSTGFPACLSIILAMVSNIFATALIADVGTGNATVAGLGVAKKANTIAFNINMGLTQGVLPLIAYNYAAKNYARMKKAITFTGSIALVFSTICVISYWIFSKGIISFFIDESSTINYGSEFLKIIAFAVPACAITYAVNTVFQAAGRRVNSFVLSILRKGLFDVPLMYALKSVMDYKGILWATPLAEIMSAGIALVMLFFFFKAPGNKNRRKSDNGQTEKCRP